MPPAVVAAFGFDELQITPEFQTASVPWTSEGQTQYAQRRRQPEYSAGETILNETFPPWLGTVLPEILKLSNLEDNWDSYGGRAVSARFVNRVFMFLRQTDVPEVASPVVVPLNDGGIQFEWQMASADFEIAFHPDGVVSYVCTTPSGSVFAEDTFMITTLTKLRKVLYMVKGAAREG